MASAQILHRPTAVLPLIEAPAILSHVVGRSTRDIRLRQLVDKHLQLVARVLRNAGTAEADVDDDLQRVFIALANRLDDVRPGAEKAFLIQTALNTAAHARRTAARRRETLTDIPIEQGDVAANPEESFQRQQMRQTLDHVLSSMETNLRSVFVLYEFEEMTAPEIAAILEIPLGTVASRLRRARSEFRDRVSECEGARRTEVG